MSEADIGGRRVERIELEIGAPLVTEAARRAAILDHFAGVVARNPKLWNGAFFLFEDVGITGDAFVARARPTDFATFLLWRAEGFPSVGHTHVFPVPAVTTADDRLLVGVMGRSTANPGLAYPPSGSFDDDDRVGGRLDPVANMMRELGEEAGIDTADLAPEAGFTVIASGPRRLALVKRWRSAATSRELAAAIAGHLGRESEPELGGFDFVPFDRRLEPTETVPYVNTLLSLLADGSGAR
jgi:8-oxo-dGTP pyrophosphatase MutT (NUDIX family)